MTDWRFVDGAKFLPLGRRGQEDAAGELTRRRTVRARPARPPLFFAAPRGVAMSAFVIQLLNGLAGASSLFLVAAGLSLIFGVTRIVNFAHGSLYMLGVYVAYSADRERSGGARSASGAAWSLAALAVGAGRRADRDRCCCGASTRRPSCSSCSPPSRVVLVIKDVALWHLGRRRTCSGRARPASRGAVEILGRAFPALRPVADRHRPAGAAARCGCCSTARAGARWCARRPQDREMVGALGVNQNMAVHRACSALGSVLAGLGGALQIPREPANLDLDLAVIADAFVVVVVGGLGSIPGAFLAAILIGVDQGVLHRHRQRRHVRHRHCLLQAHPGGRVPVMAVVLVVRPWGLLGKPQARAARGADARRAAAAGPVRTLGRWSRRSRCSRARRAAGARPTATRWSC